jgi:creatinine amidohydrolase
MDGLRRTRSYQPVLTDVRSIAPTGWYGSPQHATVEKGLGMVVKVADAISTASTEIFKQLDTIQGGVRVLKNMSDRRP